MYSIFELLTFLSDLQRGQLAGTHVSQCFELYGQPMAVPAGHVVHLSASQHLKAIPDVFENLQEGSKRLDSLF